MNLIIVESPTKAKTLNRFLGKDYSVEATLGHIKDLPKSKLGVDVEHDFKPDYVVVEKRDKEIKKLQSEAKKASRIFIATDPDREGEAIAQHVKDVLGNSKFQIPNSKLMRIVFHEITKGAVEEAIKNPRKVDKNLVDAQIGRRVLDRLVGYKLSPLLWKKVRRGLSAGRVQTVAVRLIVEKEREIEKFKAEEYWEVYCDVKSQESRIKNQEFRVKLIKINNKNAEIKNKKQSGEVVDDLKKSKYKVLDVKKKEVSKSPYPPFTTSTMTQSAARLFGWSAKRTMSVAQKLYEEGLITYHRTDSVHLANTALRKVRKFIEEKYTDKYLPEKPRFYKTKSKVAQEAHEAIRPTDIKINNVKGQLSKVKGSDRLYDLIWKRFVACQMANCIFDHTTIDVVASVHPGGDRAKQSEASGSPGVKNSKYLLRVSGQVMKFDGWRRVVPLSKNDEPELPVVEKSEELDLVGVNSQQKFTQPPARFNEASLIKTLEKLGIGRPSTYAPVISTIQLRQYVEKDEGKFRPTPVGLAVNDFMVTNFPRVFNYEFTAEMESDLDNVANGKRKWVNMMKSFYKPFEKKLIGVEKKAKRVEIPTEKLGKKCPDCKKGELVIRVGRFGKFISCSNFPDCEYKDRYVEKIGMKCPDCKDGDIIVKKTGKGRKFFGCSNYPKCKWASWKDPRTLK